MVYCPLPHQGLREYNESCPFSPAQGVHHGKVAMSHVPFVQTLGFQDTSAQEPGSGVFPTQSRTFPVGVLGGSEHYDMPRSILNSLARFLQGDISEELPPFLVACTDGFVIVMTLHVEYEFMGAAIHLPCEKLEDMDKGIFALWQRLSKESTVEEFFRGTAYSPAHVHLLPKEIDASWDLAFS